ncbi:MAG: hypothetical protein G01um10142_473 [Parcubacteria group bacterium Gr01-1014_2]|nr:MAG: hypothetical protein G01um10142_473 [Parcubacteria group bacterium Gr01-1014_2]
MENKSLHEVVITAIVIKGGKYLITKRSMKEKRFPGFWTVPGGKLETDDYIHLPKETEHYWYNVLEKVLRKEVRDEVGLEIKNIEYLTSLARVHEDKNPSLVISCIADYDSGKIKLQKDEADDYAWVNLKEAKKYKLIDGIYDELVLADKKRKGIKEEWSRI